jgi:hypothetical protein
MHWIKERVLEAEWKDPSYTETTHRIHMRMRSDGACFYQVVRRGGSYDSNPAALESRFADYLEYDLETQGHFARTQQTEAQFDAYFLDRLQRMNGKEITQVIQ